MKTCTKCKEEKPFSEFHKDKNKKDGLVSWCKICRNEYCKSDYKKNKERYKESNRKYYQKNIEKLREYSRKYRQENKETIRERQRKWRQENKEKVREQNRKYNEENNVFNRERKRKYRQENKEKVKEYNRKYKQENKDLIRKHYKNKPAGVYKITNTINGKIYVGESTGYFYRFSAHKSLLKRGVHKNPGLQTDYDQHSLDIFDFQVIEEHPPDADKKLLLERERYFINKYKEEGKELYNVD